MPPRWALSQLATLLRPRRRLRVSEWADAHRVLSPKASAEAGRWRTSRNPLLRAIMDDLSEDAPVPLVVLMKPTQAGGTEAATNWIGYVMDHIRTPKPMLVVVPTLQLLVRWVHQRLRPMIEGAACLRPLLDVSKSRDGTNRLDILDYPGGLVMLTTAGSSSGLKSDSIRFVVEDEIDEFGWDVGGMGDPSGLIASRQAAFRRRKTLRLSTPSVQGASRIEGDYLASDQRRYHVCCPHCGERQTLEWEHLAWTSDLGKVWYTCAVNGCVIEERDKPGMLREKARDYPQGGEWIAAHPERSAQSHGYAWSSLYAPIGLGFSWREMAAQWIAAQGSDERLQQFTNERLGRPWEDNRTATRPEDLAARAEPYPLRQPPRGVGLVAAGVDTQDDRLAVQILGFGAAWTWWVLDYVELPGDPGRPEVWVALTDLLNRPLATHTGALLRIEATAIDMGGHHTEAVKAFVRASRLPRCMAILGSRYRLDVVLGKPRKVDYSVQGKTQRWGMHYHPVGTELGKDILYRTLRTDADHAPAERLAHFPQDLPADYYAGLMSEAWNPKRQRYEPKRGLTRRNEPLDTWVYAYAAAHHPEIRLDRLRPSDWAAREARLWGPSPPAPEPLQDTPKTTQVPRGTPPRRPPPTSPSGGFGKSDWSL